MLAMGHLGVARRLEQPPEIGAGGEEAGQLGNAPGLWQHAPEGPPFLRGGQPLQREQPLEED
jgi:hypothetical protein